MLDFLLPAKRQKVLAPLIPPVAGTSKPPMALLDSAIVTLPEALAREDLEWKA